MIIDFCFGVQMCMCMKIFKCNGICMDTMTVGDCGRAKEFAKANKYILLARHNAELFSKDPDSKVGCIILSSDFSRQLSTGINGFARHMNDDIEERWKRPTKYSYIAHSEANAIANAARTGTPLDGSIIVVTKFPCSTCTKLLIQAGIQKIYTVAPDYDNETWGEDARISEAMLSEVGVEVVKLP
jgi:dCMP deaminase